MFTFLTGFTLGVVAAFISSTVIALLMTLRFGGPRARD